MDHCIISILFHSLNALYPQIISQTKTVSSSFFSSLFLSIFYALARALPFSHTPTHHLFNTLNSLR